LLDRWFDHSENVLFSQRYTFGLIHKLREHIGLDDRFDDDPWTRIVRAKLFRYVCTYGDSECRANAATKLLAYMGDPVANKWVLSVTKDYQLLLYA